MLPAQLRPEGRIARLEKMVAPLRSVVRNSKVNPRPERYLSSRSDVFLMACKKRLTLRWTKSRALLRAESLFPD